MSRPAKIVVISIIAFIAFMMSLRVEWVDRSDSPGQDGPKILIPGKAWSICKYWPDADTLFIGNRDNPADTVAYTVYWHSGGTPGAAPDSARLYYLHQTDADYLPAVEGVPSGI